ncbi:MAG: hypothetical protein ACOC2Q_03200, partial [Spirochaetota bacterium]
MRFANRLLIMVAVVLIAFTSVSVLGVRVLGETRQIADLSADLERLVSETWNLQSLTFELRLTEDFRYVIPEWQASAEELGARLSAIGEDPIASRLTERDETFGEQMSKLRNLVDLVQNELDAFEEALSEFTDGFTVYPAVSMQR